MLNRSGIYKITCTANGRFYIGSAVNFKARWSYHRRDVKAGKHSSRHLQRAWNKYGPDMFDFKVMLVCKKDDLLMYEQRAIDTLKPEFNMSPTAGSCLGVKHTEAARKRNSERNKVRWADPVKRAEQSARTKKAMADPATKERVFSALRAQQATITSEVRKAAYTPEVRAKMSAKVRARSGEVAKKISAGLRKSAKKYSVLGEELCMVEITEKYGISRCLFKSRMKLGWSEEVAASKSQKVGVTYVLYGNSYSANELAKIAGCSPSAFRKRVNRCATIEDAVERGRT